MVILALIGGAAGAIAIIEGYIKVMPAVRKYRFDKNVTIKLNKELEDFLNKEFGVKFTRSIKTSYDVPEQYPLDSAILIPLKTKKPDVNNCPVEIAEISAAIVKQEILTEFGKQDYEEDALQEVSSLAAEKFVRGKIRGKIIKNEQSIDSVVDKIKSKSSPVKKAIIRKNYDQYRKELKKRILPTTFNRDYSKNVLQKVSKQKSVHSILKEKQKVKRIQRDKEVGGTIVISADSLKIIKKLKVARLKSLDKLRAAVDKTDIKMRSEEIFAYVLEHWGHYLKEMSDNSDIPISTISRYISAMEEKGIVVKNPHTKEGQFRKYVYPAFSQDELIKNWKTLQGETIAISGKVKDVAGTMCVKNFEKIGVDISRKYLGKDVIFVGVLQKEKKRVSLNVTSIE